LSGLSTYTVGSSYYIREDGTFTFFFGNDVSFDGTYVSENGELSMSWEVEPAPSVPWHATATVTGDELTVRYNAAMEAEYFENAVYGRVR
jgi:hypothetical protein